MARVIYHTATTLDGYLADGQDSLSWLFAVPGAADSEDDFSVFLEGIGAFIMGSTTYEWVLDHEFAGSPEKWWDAYGDRVCFVATTRTLPGVGGADIRFFSGDVADVWPVVREAAGDRDVWLVGGGDLVGQFDDSGLLDEVRVSVAPVTLGSGRPLLPRRIESDRLELVSVGRAGQFAELVYRVGRPG